LAPGGKTFQNINCPQEKNISKYVITLAAGGKTFQVYKTGPRRKKRLAWSARTEAWRTEAWLGRSKT
jgi:hypothetical protein